MEGENITVTSLLRSDHRRIEALLSRLDATPDEELGLYFGELWEQVISHEIGVELVVYPQVRRYVPEGDDLANSRLAEQRQIQQHLLELDKRTDYLEPSFRQSLYELRANSTSHTKAEADEVLPKLEAFAPREVLTTMAAAYARAVASAPGHGDLAAASKAQHSDIDGLVDEVRDVMFAAL